MKLSDRMTEVAVGAGIYELKKKIQNLSIELNQIHSPTQIPELINSANLLRANETLTLANLKQSEIIRAYQTYSNGLETLLNNIFEIQMELKEVLKMQTSMLSAQKPSKKKSPIKKKTKN